MLPSNEGRGYVLRKIMRRAMRNARLIGVEEPFLYKLTGFVAELMQPAYPEMMESVQRVARVVKDEEHRYATTFLVAEKVFNERIKSLRGGMIPGAVSFKLYDTYGLALDEQEEMAREHGLAIDREGFEREMEQQRERARASWKGAEKGAVVPAYQQLLERGRTKFLGYETMEADRAGDRPDRGPAAGGARCLRAPGRSWCSTGRRSTPKPAARWATAARSIRATGEQGGRRGDRRSTVFPG